MGFSKFLLVLMGLVFVLLSYAVHAGSCSQVTITAENTILNEDSTTNYDFSVRNNSSDAFYIDNFEAISSSSLLDAVENGLVDYTLYPGETTTGHLRLIASALDYDRIATISLRVNGHFSNTNCSSTQILDSFTVQLINGGSSSGDCSSIEVSSFNFSVPEESTTFQTFKVYNRAGSDFIIEDAQADNSNPYFTVTKESLSSNRITGNSNIDFRIKVVSQSVSSQQSGTAYARVRGHFENGRTCSFGNIGEENYTVTVNNSGAGSCGNISIDAENVFVDEGTTETNYFYIINNSNRAFTLDGSPQISEDSSYYSQSIDSYDSSVSSNSSGTIRARTVADSVAGTKTGTSTLRVQGHFSDGNSCSFSDLSRDFQTTVRDITDNGNGTSSVFCDDLAIESHTVEVNANDSTNDTFFLRNDSTRNFYLDSVKVNDSSDLFASSLIDFEDIARRNGENAAINFKIQAYGSNSSNSGTATMQVNGHFSDGTVCSFSSIGTKTFTVNVNTVQASIGSTTVSPGPVKVIEITDYPARVDFKGNTFIPVTVRNNSALAKNIVFGFSGFPAGIMLETNSYDFAGNSTRTVFLDIDARGKTGIFSGILFIQSENARDEKPITIAAGAGTAVQTENISMDVQVSENNGTYDLVVKIKNNLQDAVFGNVAVDLPAGWKISGITEISISSGEEKTTILNVVPNEMPSKEIISAVQYTTSTGEQAKKTFAFKPTTGIIGTALLTLSESAIAIGIIVLAAIIIVAIAQRLWN